MIFLSTSSGLSSFPYRPEGLSEQMTDLDEERLNEGVHNTLKALEARLSDLHDILVDPPKV